MEDSSNNGKSPDDNFNELLLREYDYLSRLFIANEQLGEKRVDLFITLTTIVVSLFALIAGSDALDTFAVEDTSLYLECLAGLPGPLIRWFLQTIGNEGLFKICDKLKNYEAEARTIIGYAKDSQIEFFEGSIKGTIVSPRGRTGFGWDRIFKPKGYQETFSEMPKEEKNKISMRRLALNKLKQYLETNQ